MAAHSLHEIAPAAMHHWSRCLDFGFGFDVGFGFGFGFGFDVGFGFGVELVGLLGDLFG